MAIQIASVASTSEQTIRHNPPSAAMPASTSPKDLTALLLDWRNGDEDALGCLIPMVHKQLKRLAGGHLRGERVGHTLQPTALVNEAYLRLIDQKRVQWKSRAHFFGIASHLMRRILVDHARRRQADKRHGQAMAVSLDEALSATNTRDVDLVRLDDALTDLAARCPRQSRIIELRFFGGLTIEETAHVIKVSAATVKLDWAMAKSWIFSQIKR